jgi:uncharacterized protein YndB with AHSA1/START domain
MAAGIPDELVRTVDVKAPRERVWDAITKPELLLRWFPTHVAEVELRVGGSMRFGWDEGGDEAVIDEIEPPHTFRFRWRPADTDRPYTSVTFHLEEDAGVTTVTLTERGFASLPDQIHEQSYEGNAKGWSAELEELKAFMEGS